MKIVSNTTRYSDERLKEIILFVKPNGLSTAGMIFQFQQGSGYGTSGRSWRRARKIHVRMGGNYANHKRVRRGGGGYLPSVTYTHEEEVVQVIAHELRHQWQYVNPRGHRVWGARAQVSERDADAYAIHMMREWRRRKDQTSDLKNRLELFQIVRNTERVAASHK